MIDWPEAARKGELIAAGANAVIALALLATRRWWREPESGEKSPPAADAGAASSRWGKWFGLAACAVLVLAGAVRWKFAHSSLWWDEVWQARNASVGDWKPDKKRPGELKFVETTWAQALWNYRKPTNHAPMALAGKVCHEIWQKATGAKPGEFSEFALRFPGFLASLASVAGLAFILRAWGRPAAGLVAALVLALHPWHVRYGIDARGYAFLVPLVLLGLWSLWKACGRGERSGRAVWWWVFGLNQALILWCHLLSAWVCVALTATGCWWIHRNRPPGGRMRPALRLIAVQAAGAMLFFQLFLPQLVQASQWGERNQDGNVVDAAYLLKTASQLATGRDWVAKPEYLSDPATGAWLHGAVGLLALVVFTAVGLHALRRARAVALAPVVALFVTCLALVLITWTTGFYFYHRFILAVIVPVVIAVAYGILEMRLWAWHLWLGSYPRRTASLALRFGWMVLLFHWGMAMVSQLQTMARTPYAPLRETAAALREAEKGNARTFGVGFGAEALQFYHPALAWDRDRETAAASLEKAVAEAKAAGCELWVVVSYEELNRATMPAVFAVLDDPARFTRGEPFPALEPEFSTRIYRTVAK